MASAFDGNAFLIASSGPASSSYASPCQVPTQQSLSATLTTSRSPAQGVSLPTPAVLAFVAAAAMCRGVRRPAQKLRSQTLREATEAATEAAKAGSVAEDTKEAKGAIDLEVTPEAADDEDDEDAATQDVAIVKRKKFKKRVIFQPSEEPGVTAPLGFFDPLGFCPPGDENNFQKLRAAELKHGRVCMLASIGLFTQHFIRFPFGFVEAPAGIDAVNVIPGKWGWWLIQCAAAWIEYGLWREDMYKEPGNYGDPLGLNMYTREMRDRELNNGRFAMFATVGIYVAEWYTDKDAAEQLGFPPLDLRPFIPDL
eukprot:TRINITY_DN8773_c0_g2_i1.p1 TRINITY_DN8773_c0_g2~~TRINITY_DN8773_c0_g2_i1.p1  ORF type:complete len:311 (-),score=57.65 TRINITY_DN8773_c0_g2_i1:143-1075(-)